MLLSAATIGAVAPGKLDVSIETAETVEVMHMTWRAGQWRLTKIN